MLAGLPLCWERGCQLAYYTRGLASCWERGCHFAYYAIRVATLLGKRLSFCLLCYSGCHLVGKKAVILLVMRVVKNCFEVFSMSFLFRLVFGLRFYYENLPMQYSEIFSALKIKTFIGKY